MLDAATLLVFGGQRGRRRAVGHDPVDLVDECAELLVTPVARALESVRELGADTPRVRAEHVAVSEMLIAPQLQL